jgi:hypothetical protein
MEPDRSISYRQARVVIMDTVGEVFDHNLWPIHGFEESQVILFCRYEKLVSDCPSREDREGVAGLQYILGGSSAEAHGWMNRGCGCVSFEPGAASDECGADFTHGFGAEHQAELHLSVM